MSPTAADPYAHLKDNGWREIAQVDEQLARGDIDEAEWHAAMARLIVPNYLAADTPWGGSGKSGTHDDWEYSRSLIAHAVDRDGSFLDVGCANGYLLESLPDWTPHRLDLHGVDIAPELVDLARRRLPSLAGNLEVGNALDWQPARRFDFVRANLDAAPVYRRRELVGRLLDLSGRLIIGVYNEQVEERPTESLLRSWGYAIAGRSERTNRHKPQVDYRVLWIDSEEGR